MFGGVGLLGSNGAESHHDLFFNGPSIVEQGAGNGFNAFDASFVDSRAGVGHGGVLGSGTIGDRSFFVGQELGLGGVQVIVTGKEFLYVAFHG